MESIPEETFKLIFEYLRDDLNCLLSCLVVNKQWARVTVETMWRNPWRYIKNTKGEDSKKAEVKLISILISFLPEDSRAILREHGIIIPSPLQSPLYDYAGLSRYLTHYDVNRMTELILTLPEYKGSVETTTLTCQSESYTSYLIKQELYRMYVDQCRALKLLEFRDADIPLPFFREAERCFSNLCELHCDTTLLSGTYYRMAQICQNLERLVIVDCHYDNDGLATLIEVQNNLGYLKIITKGSDEHGNSRHNRYIRIANAISTQAHSLHHFDIGGSFVKAIPPVTIATFENLRTLHIRFEGKYEDILKYSSFSQLQVLKCYHVPNPMDVLTHFIERTGGLLRKISFKINSVGDFTMIPQYNKKIAESCPNIRSLTTWFRTDSVADFRQVLISCPNLEHLTIGNYENEDGYYEAQMDKLLTLIESVEMEIKPRLLRLRKLEFKCMWKIRYKELESYLRKRKERILSSNQPLILMELYFNLANIGEDDKNTLMNTLDCYKSEGLIKRFAIKEIA